MAGPFRTLEPEILHNIKELKHTRSVIRKGAEVGVNEHNGEGNPYSDVGVTSHAERNRVRLSMGKVS